MNPPFVRSFAPLLPSYRVYRVRCRHNSYSKHDTYRTTLVPVDDGEEEEEEEETIHRKGMGTGRWGE